MRLTSVNNPGFQLPYYSLYLLYQSSNMKTITVIGLIGLGMLLMKGFEWLGRFFKMSSKDQGMFIFTMAVLHYKKLLVILAIALVFLGIFIEHKLGLL